MIKAWYSSKDEIPEWARPLFHEKNGRWELDPSKVENGEQIFTPTMAAKNSELLSEKATWKAKADAAEAKTATAESELSKLKAPGTVIINSDEKKQLDTYQAIGTVKDLTKIKAEHATQKEALTKIESEKLITQVAKDTGLNTDVLVDFLNSDRGKDLKIISKPGKTKDAKGKETDVKLPFIVKTVKVGDVLKEEEVALADYAKANLPDYMTKALYEKPSAANVVQNGQQTQTGLRVPIQSSTTSNQTKPEEGQSRAAKFNASRNTRPALFETTEQK